MELMNPNNLRPHPRNNEFFDDMDGQKWKDFLQSVRTSGIIEPIIVTQDLVIVSGHQRVRAAKTLGIMKVAVEMRHYEDEDKVLRDLIETNIKQRGVGNPNDTKMGYCVLELERIYGISHGNNRYTNKSGHNVNSKTQDELAEELNVSKRQLSRFKKLTELVPELQEAVQTGKISSTNASAILAKLPKEQQIQIAEQIIGMDGKVSKQELENLRTTVSGLQEENARLKNRQPEVIEKVVEKKVEVESEFTKRRLENLEKENKKLISERQEFVDKWKKSEQERKALEDEMKKPENERAEKIKTSALFFCAGVSNFIEKYGGYVWLADSLNEMEKSERDGYLKAVNALEGWVYQMKQNMKG